MKDSKTSSSDRTKVGGRKKKKAAQTETETYRFFGLPTPVQIVLLVQFMGACRFLWNRMLSDIKAAYARGEKFSVPLPSSYKKEKGLEWLKDMDSLSLCNVQLRLYEAFQRFFKGLKGEGPEFGYPKFKKKSDCKDSYTTNLANAKHPNIRLDGDLLKLPKIKTPIKLLVHRKIRKGGILKNVTVTREPSGKWYFSLTFEYAKETPKKKPAASVAGLRHKGLDMSLSKLYVDSDGNEADFCKPYHRLEDRIGREQHKQSRMVKGSNNYQKQSQKIAGLHAKAKHQRDDMLHKLSYRLTRDYDVISIEDLDMAAMKRALKFGKSVSDNGWGNFVRMLGYKCERTGSLLVKVDKWFPSSKTCIRCGYIHKELALSDREYVCPLCGHVMDRDHQAAMNIDLEGLRIVADQLSAA